MMVTTKSFALTFLHYSSHNFCELFSINMMNQAAETLIRYKKKKKKATTHIYFSSFVLGNHQTVHQTSLNSAFSLSTRRWRLRFVAPCYFYLMGKAELNESSNAKQANLWHFKKNLWVVVGAGVLRGYTGTQIYRRFGIHNKKHANRWDANTNKSDPHVFPHCLFRVFCWWGATKRCGRLASEN